MLQCGIIEQYRKNQAQTANLEMTYNNIQQVQNVRLLYAIGF